MTTSTDLLIESTAALADTYSRAWVAGRVRRAGRVPGWSFSG
ncbi:hypothetical protein [Cryobacterium sp. MLB-32]|nr:hypothetical protein [Cryobacterium sp. MLB-32]